MALRSFVPERTENAVVKLTMDGVAYDRLKDSIDTLELKIGRVDKIDTVNITYEFTIEYYNVVNSLRSLIILLKDPSVSSAMIGSRDALNLLFVDLIDVIREAQKMLETVESQ